jgi:periplasmic mercuric ion binding protein
LDAYTQGEIMKLSFLTTVASLALALAWAGAARAETKVELKNVHLCCPMCKSAVEGILKKTDASDVVADTKAKTVTFTTKDDAAAKKALQALADGGFQGDTGNKDLAIPDDSGVEKGKVKTLTVTGVHDCCGQCNGILQKTLKGVDGVTGNTAKAKSDTFEVTGDFDAVEVIKALNAAGFHVKVKK